MLLWYKLRFTLTIWVVLNGKDFVTGCIQESPTVGWLEHLFSKLNDSKQAGLSITFSETNIPQYCAFEVLATLEFSWMVVLLLSCSSILSAAGGSSFVPWVSQCLETCCRVMCGRRFIETDRLFRPYNVASVQIPNDKTFLSDPYFLIWICKTCNFHVLVRNLLVEENAVIVHVMIVDMNVVLVNLVQQLSKTFFKVNVEIVY